MRPERIHHSEPVEVSRTELHKLVWSTPMIHLAADYGISDVALRKWCVKLQIPTPPPGHWSKVDAGHAVHPEPLLPPKSEVPERILLSASPKPVGELREFDPVLVTDRLSRPHPLVAATLKEIAGWEEGRHGVVAPRAGLDVRVTRACQERAFRIFDALIRAAEEQGWPLDHAEKYSRYQAPTAFLVDGTRVPVYLDEVRKQVKDEDRRGRSRTRVVGVGTLRLEVGGSVCAPFGARRRFNEKRSPLEAQLHKVLTSIDACAQMLRKKHADYELRRQEREKQQAEERLRREEELRARQEEERKAKLEAERRADAFRRIDDLRRSRELLELADLLEQQGQESVDYVAWVRALSGKLRDEALDLKAVEGAPTRPDRQD